MNTLWTSIVLMFLFSQNIVHAGQVRRVIATPEQPITVNLSFGKTTVLAFSQRPENVVPGNPAQVHVEFLRNDLNVSPVGSQPGNLVVYTKTARLVILLKVVGGAGYDDVVTIGERIAMRPISLSRDSSHIEEIEFEFKSLRQSKAPSFSKSITISIAQDKKTLVSEDLFEQLASPAKFRCQGCRSRTNGGAMTLQCAKGIDTLHCQMPGGEVLLRRSP